MTHDPDRVFDSAMRAAIDREAKASAALDGETVVCEPTRQFDPDLGEVTTQAEDGEVIRVEEPKAGEVNIKPELDALYSVGKRVGLIRAATLVHALYRELMAEAEKK